MLKQLISFEPPSRHAPTFGDGLILAGCIAAVLMTLIWAHMDNLRTQDQQAAMGAIHAVIISCAMQQQAKPQHNIGLGL